MNETFCHQYNVQQHRVSGTLPLRRRCWDPWSRALCWRTRGCSPVLWANHQVFRHQHSTADRAGSTKKENSVFKRSEMKPFFFILWDTGNPPTSSHFQLRIIEELAHFLFHSRNKRRNCHKRTTTIPLSKPTGSSVSSTKHTYPFLHFPFSFDKVVTFIVWIQLRWIHWMSFSSSLFNSNRFEDKHAGHSRTQL